MADDRRPPHSPQAPEQDSGDADLDAAYTAEYRAFMKHVSDPASKCDCRRGTDCEEAVALKLRMRETRSASLAARRAAR